MAATARAGLQDALFLQDPQVVAHRLLRDPGLKREIPLRRPRVPPQDFNQRFLERAKPDALAAAVRLRVRGEEPLVHALPLGPDETRDLERPQVVRERTVREAEVVANLGEVRPRLGLDDAEDLSANEVVEDLFLLEPRVQREEGSEDRMPAGLRPREECREAAEDPERHDPRLCVDGW